jgi:hypothetical protein
MSVPPMRERVTRLLDVSEARNRRQLGGNRTEDGGTDGNRDSEKPYGRRHGELGNPGW